MACSSPITVSTEAGPIEVPCKQCLNCRILRQSGLTLRNILEHSCSLRGDFWTLTYRDPCPEKLDYSDFSSFLKRLRRLNQTQENPVPIRFFSCGEYGTKTGRPHFHALIYNDLSRKSDRTLTRLWPHGFSYIGTATPQSIRYTARYCLKFGEKGKDSIANWSLKPGLGATGMRSLAQYHVRNNYRIDKVPTTLKIGKNKYFVDETLRAHYIDEYNNSSLSENELGKGSLYNQVLQYELRKLYDDPIERQALHQEARNFLFAQARFTNEKI